MKLNYSGHRVLLLGGSSSIGLELAELLLAEGLDVEPTHCSDIGQKSIQDRFPDLTPYYLNLADRNSYDNIVPVIASGVDYLVDLAQADYEELLAAAHEDRIEAYFQAHVTGRLLLLNRIARTMLARRFGRLLHVSSTAASLPATGQGFYAAAKNAAESLYLSMGLELGVRGVTSLSLRLGMVDAGRGSRFLDHGQRRQDMTGKILTASQAAHTLCFLLSDQARALTCTTITMDAGLSAMKYQ